MQAPSHFRNWSAPGSPVPMAAGKRSSGPIYRQCWFIAVAAVSVVVVIVALVVPLAILLPKRGNSSATVLVPLYIYPSSNSTWDPLFSAVTAHQGLQFVVVVNPQSGPGSSRNPDDQYAAALSTLKQYSNVRTVGYVRTGYAERELSDVLSDISTYAGWGLNNASHAMHGIFFDEAPHQFAESADAFMRKATEAAKQANGLGGAMVVRNPGVVPDARFNDSNTDVTVVFEQSYDEYQALQGSLASLTTRRSQSAYIVHSTPAMSRGQRQSVVKNMRKHAKFLFMTANSEDYYESFGDDWADFADAAVAR